MSIKKIIKDYGHGGGSILFFKDECLIEKIDREDSVEIISLKKDGVQILLPTGSYIRKVIKQRSSALLCFPAEVMKILGLKIGDIIEIEYKVHLKFLQSSSTDSL